MIPILIKVRNINIKKIIFTEIQYERLGLNNHRYEKIANGQLNTIKDINDSLNPSTVDALSSSFTDSQLSKDIKPNKIHTINPTIYAKKQKKYGDAPLSLPLKNPSMIGEIITIANKKYVTVKMKYNRSYIFIILGFSSMLSFLYERYCCICINFFGRLSVIETNT
jgi:hypothetical protein